MSTKEVIKKTPEPNSNQIAEVKPLNGNIGAAEIGAHIRRHINDGDWLPGQRIPTEQELAITFNVSRSTIAKALQELDRQGLLQSRKRQGRIVVQSNPSTIAVIIGATRLIGHPVQTQRLEGIQSVLNEHQLSMSVHGIYDAGENEEAFVANMVKMLSSGSIGGLIVVPGIIRQKIIEQLADMVPTVWIDHASVRPGLKGVLMDHLRGAFLAAEYLLNLGHSRIGLVLARYYPDIWQEVYSGISWAMLQKGIDKTTNPISYYQINSAFEEASGEKAAEAFLADPNRPSAVYCFSAELAAGFAKAVKSNGLRVPEDVSIISANSLLPGTEPFQMTRINWHYDRIGQIAAEILLEMLYNKSPQKIWQPDPIVRADLIEGDSTAPPATMKQQCNIKLKSFEASERLFLSFS